MTDEKVYLSYILECISNIQELIAGGYEALMAAKHNKAALLYYLHTLAEATQRLSDDTRFAHPEIPWAAIGGFRNRLVHGYLDVNWMIIWEIVTKDLPPLQAVVKNILNETES